MKIAINTKFLRVIALAPFLCLAIWQPAAVSGQPQIKPNVFVSDHRISLGGKTINYTATAGETMLKDEKGKPIAAIGRRHTLNQIQIKDARLRLCYMVVLAGRLLNSI